MSRKNKIVLISCFVALLTLFAQEGLTAEPSMATYTSYPIFQLNTVAPNILIILDNSASMNEQAYVGPYDHSIEYYGYFEPYKKYSYGSNIFVRNPAGAWDGNFLNWLTMRKIDVARKVLMGGLATSRQGTGNQTNIGEAPSVAGMDFIKTFVDTDTDSMGTNGVTPFDNLTNYTYLVDGGNFYVNAGVYTIKVDKNMIAYPDEAPSFVDGNIAGVLQKIGDRARWGNMFFNYGTGSNGSGGSVVSTIGTNMTSLVTDLQNTSCNTWTPLAEAMYVATQYFKQEDVQSGLDYPNGCAPHSNLGDDPYYNGTEFVHCAKSFVLLLTDGMSTMDMRIPDALKDVDEDGNDPGSFPDSGSDYLDDVALYARTTDLRSPTVGKTDLDGEQNLILYTVYAFGNDPDAEQLLKDASRNGGYVEKNGTKGPDLQMEWDADNNGDPDTYYKADTGYQLEAKILQAINDILARAASGTAVSVLASSSEGEGNLIQAYYRPAITQGITEYKWLGYLQSLWVDPMGNLREDTNHNLILDLDADRPVKYFLDPETGDTMLKRYDASPTPDFQNGTYQLVQLDEIVPLWEAGSLLASRESSSRNIFTFVDIDGDGVVDESSHKDPFDKFGETIGFDTIKDVNSDCGAGKNCIKPYLGVKDDLTWSYLGADHDTRVENLINYIRGDDIAGLRRRFVDGTNNVWKLADIVNSTPVSVNKPVENYHIIYSDESYQAYLDASLNRETIVYVGANDGMLHAFTSWEYDKDTKAFKQPLGTTEGIGDEIWAYIPNCLLPHLKWFASPDYTHVYYADLKPKVFDAKLDLDGDGVANWGTFLLLGLNMGGKYIQVTDDFDYDAATTDTTRDFYPTYTLLNVTDPRNPQVIWERTYTDLELSTSLPAVVKVKDKWFAVFGSGPSDYDGTSNKKGHVFVVDLKTGNPYGSGGNDWLFETGENSAFLNSPVSLDEGLNFSVDAIYFGETYLSGSWKGKLYKLTVPWVDASGNYDGVDLANYVDNPLDATHPWQFAPLFNATRPISAPVSVSRDTYNNIWIFGGTGRYLSTADKTDTDTQYIFGIKDPFYNIEHTPAGLHADDYYLNYNASIELVMSDLLNTDAYVVTTGDEVFDGGGTSIGNFEAMKDLVYVKDGWVRTLSLSKERIIQKPSLLGGLVYVPSFVPNGDVCGYGGDSYLYGLYYETGTAYFEKGFENNGTTTVDINGEPVDQVVDKISLGYGKASSLGIHVGQEEGAKGYIQQSTGTVLNEDLNPALSVKSGLRCWREK